MNLTWSTPKPAKVRDAYLDWFDHVYQPGTDGAFGYDIILVKLKETGQPASFLNTLNWLAAEADAATSSSDFIMDNVERARVADMIANPALIGDAPDVFLHQSHTAKKFAATYKKQFTPLAQRGPAFR